MIRKYLLFLLVILFIFSSCKRNAIKLEERNKRIERIKKIEDTFNGGLKKDTVLYDLGRKLSVMYDSFIVKYPKDTMTPKIIYLQGALYLKYLADYNKSISYFSMLYEKYPKFRRTPEALFAVANLYNDFLKKPEDAKKYFEIIIDKYPENRLAGDSKILLRNIGKSDEELWKDIQKQKGKVKN